MRDIASLNPEDKASDEKSPKLDCVDKFHQLPSLNTQPSIDQLDRFPDVPESRPTSLVSTVVSPRHSRGQSQSSYHAPTPHLAKTSSVRVLPSRPRQLLSQSNIFIVVDSDPVTTRFRAGAMSPAPSIGGSLHSRGGSLHQQIKHARQPSNLKETINIPGSSMKVSTNRRSLHSLASQKTASARSSLMGPGKHKRPNRNSNRSINSSSEESQLVLAAKESRPAQKISSKSQRRRRWNSGDINHVKTLEQALEYYRGTIMKQEERLRDQADQIQMMIRVIAPMNRARGVKSSSGLEAILDYSTAEENHPTSYRGSSKRSSGNKGNKALKTGLNSTLNTKERLKSRNRSKSTDDNSTASASPSAIMTDATKVSTDDASMTDPFEYDLAAGHNTAKKGAKSLLPGRKAAPTVAPIAALTHRPTTREKVAGIGALNNAAVLLHQPPPVSKATPLCKRFEDMSLFSSSTENPDRAGAHEDESRRNSIHTLSRESGLKYHSLNEIAAEQRHRDRHHYRRHYRHGGDDNGNYEPSLDSEVENQRDVARLSINHRLVSTEQMDRAIAHFMYVG